MMPSNYMFCVCLNEYLNKGFVYKKYLTSFCPSTHEFSQTSFQYLRSGTTCTESHCLLVSCLLQLSLCNLWDSAAPKIPRRFIFNSCFMMHVFLSAALRGLQLLHSGQCCCFLPPPPSHLSPSSHSIQLFMSGPPSSVFSRSRGLQRKTYTDPLFLCSSLAPSSSSSLLFIHKQMKGLHWPSSFPSLPL